MPYADPAWVAQYMPGETDAQALAMGLANPMGMVRLGGASPLGQLFYTAPPAGTDPVRANFAQFLKALAGGLGPEGGSSIRRAALIDLTDALERGARFRPIMDVLAGGSNVRMPFLPGARVLEARLEKDATSSTAREVRQLKRAMMRGVTSNFVEP